MDADQSSDPLPSLTKSKVDRGLGHYARAFIAFREEHDFYWELSEALMTSLVFALLFLGYEAQEHYVGLASHVIVFILLVLKFLSLGGAWWATRHSPGLGTD